MDRIWLVLHSIWIVLDKDLGSNGQNRVGISKYRDGIGQGLG